MNEFYPIPGYHPYEITKDGQIKGQRVGILKHWISKTSKDNYPCVNMFGTRTFVHRLLAYTFIPNPNNYPCINHKDGNKLNYSLSNLEWCTHKQNSHHAISMGIEGRRNTILDEIQVKTILSCLKNKEVMPKQLAYYFNVSYSTIHFIKSKRNWKNTTV